MWKILGGVFLLGGVAGVLHNWTVQQQKRQRRLEEFLVFFQRSIAIMETEKIKVIEYFAKQNTKELQEIAMRLSTNTYPNGQMAWEEVFREEEQNLSFDEDTFQIILNTADGFFGRSRNENVRFLKKSVCFLEEQQRKIKEKEKQERKVWIPVGMLGAVMLVIILI